MSIRDVGIGYRNPMLLHSSHIGKRDGCRHAIKARETNITRWGLSMTLPFRSVIGQFGLICGATYLLPKRPLKPCIAAWLIRQQIWLHHCWRLSRAHFHLRSEPRYRQSQLVVTLKVWIAHYLRLLRRIGSKYPRDIDRGIL